jgi:hypothetical protein
MPKDGGLTVCGMSIGSLRQKNAAEICQGYDPCRMPFFKLILEEGPAGLLGLARQRGIQPDPQGYYSVCSMCAALRKQLEEEQISRLGLRDIEQKNKDGL